MTLGRLTLAVAALGTALGLMIPELPGTCGHVPLVTPLAVRAMVAAPFFALSLAAIFVRRRSKP